MLWLEEKSDPPVWHQATERLDTGLWRVACGWELTARDARRLWPVKETERGPAFEERCHTCVDNVAIAVDPTADAGSAG